MYDKDELISQKIFGCVMILVGILFNSLGIWALLENDIISMFFLLVGGSLFYIGLIQFLMIKTGLYDSDPTIEGKNEGI